MTTRRRLMAAGALIACLPALGSRWGDTPADQLMGLMVGYGAAGLPFLYVLRRWPGFHRAGEGRHTLWALLGLALAVRLALLWVPPLLSEDLWRYLWDGLVQHAGHNPYRFAPNDPALDGVAQGAAAAVRAQVGHPHIPTIYPPFAQWVFWGAAGVGPHLWGLRTLLIFADVATVAGIWALVAARGGARPHVALLYALCPLAVVESAVGAHVDALAVAPTVWGLVALARGRHRWAGLGLAAGIAAKLLPLLAVPWLALRRRWATLAAMAIALLVFTAPYVGAGRLALRGLAAYGARWRGNDGLFALAVAGFERRWPPAQVPVDLPPWAVRALRAVVGTPPGGVAAEIWPDEAAFAAAKLCALAVFGAVCVVALWRARSAVTFLGPCILALYLVAPVVHPWYLAWPLALAVATWAEGPAPWAAATLAWAGTAWLAYVPRVAYLAGEPWVEPLWSRWIEYLPVAGVLAIFAAQRYNSSRAERAPTP